MPRPWPRAHLTPAHLTPAHLTPAHLTPAHLAPAPLPVAPVGPLLPHGLGVALRPDARVCAGASSVSGAGADRVLYLRPAAAAVLRTLPARAEDPVARRLGRTLVDAGVAEPWWPEPGPDDDEVAAAGQVSLVVPVRDRAWSLARLLGALPPALEVLVVDDGSREPIAVADVTARYGARLVRHDTNRGPAAARNTGLREATTPLVVLCDSDVVPQPGWLAALHRHLEDPVVAVAAPRVLGLDVAPGKGARGWVGAYEQARSSLDLGPQAAQVRPRSAVSYVPSACLLVRRDAVLAAPGAAAFDERLRSGEDVDLVWRLVAAGWRVRYEPAARVRHDHRTDLVSWARRKAFYGSSAADLAARHGDVVAPMVLSPWSAVLAGAVLAQRRWSPVLALTAWAVATVGVSRRLPQHPALPAAAALTTRGAIATLSQLAGSLNRHHWPVAAVAAAGSSKARRAWLVAALLEAVADRRRVGSTQHPLAYLVVHRLDDLAYGTGLWWGAARARSPRALLPAVVGLPRVRGRASRAT